MLLIGFGGLFCSVVNGDEDDGVIQVKMGKQVRGKSGESGESGESGKRGEVTFFGWVDHRIPPA